jgi:mevalonate kinase
VARWLEDALYLVPVNQRPPGYNPLGVKHLNPESIQELGETGRECFNAILNKNVHSLGASMNHCMKCWETILPHTVEHPSINIDLKAILAWFQARYPGAMYSGCGGGYMIVASERPVPGSVRIKVGIPAC